MLSLESWLSWTVVIVTSVTILLLLLPTTYALKDDTSKGDGKRIFRTQVLVLGDMGRSPRMQYHALSIAKHGGHVDLIGYQESDLHPDILSDPLIVVYPIMQAPRFLKTKNKWVFLVFGPLKVVFQIWSLWVVLGYRTKPAKWMLVQNPPAIPTLVVARMICLIRNTRLIIDWHNFGYSILALRLGHAHPLVRLSRLYEQTFSRSAIAHLTVTNAMARILRQDYKISMPVLPLHDRPPLHFQPLDQAQRLAFLNRLPETASHFDDLNKGKLKLLVSSTSWTPDENFTLLLEALANYSELATTSSPHLSELLVIVTGKGPQKAAFLSQIESLKAGGKLEMVEIKTAWLSADDYASLLGAADLGVSLHVSSSGVDLPMKVVDMFGAGLPVVGWDDFEAWPELVTEGVNGIGFRDVKGLQAVLVDLFGGGDKMLQHLKEGAIKEGERRWDEEWNPVMGRLLGFR